jgi:predicted nucleotidyltransferase
MQAREGDLIRIESNVIFDVKGLIHPPNRVIAFPRYIPSAQGTRKNKNASYRKVYSLGDRLKYLQENHPDLIVFDPVFGETLCEVPYNQIVQHFTPTEKLASLRSAKHLSELEGKALQLAARLKEKANIQWNAIGISGSIMAGLTTEASDIDPLVYGAENSFKAYEALEKLRTDLESGFKPYTNRELQDLFDFRSKDTQMSFEDFQKVESRKAFQGKFLGTDYFVRFVKEWDELSEQYGDVFFKNSGYARISATTVANSDSLFTPCTYKISEVKVLVGPILTPIEEVVSFRGRFCEQAKIGEKIEAQGKVELVTNKSGTQHYRMILGNKPSDYMVLQS